jgi:hypothetical protein
MDLFMQVINISDTEVPAKMARVLTSASLEMIKGRLALAPRLEAIRGASDVVLRGDGLCYDGPFYKRCLPMYLELAESKLPVIETKGDH